MIRPAVARQNPAQRGFTLIELLVALALIVVIMTILNGAFGAATESFRNLKAIGDQQEKLRGTATNLRRDLAAANFDSASLIVEGLRGGGVDRERVSDLRKRYEAIAADASAFDAQLQEVEDKLENPADKRIIRRARGSLGQIEFTTSGATRLLELIELGSKD